MEYENLDGVLVKLVKKHSNIYDKAHAQFKNKASREVTWATIAQTLKKTKDECHQRWNVLRTRYALEKRKARTEGKQSTWPLYETMSFLDKFMLPRRSYGHYKSVASNCEIVPAYAIWDEKPDVVINTDGQSEEDKDDNNTMSSYDGERSPMENMINPAHIKEEPFDNDTMVQNMSQKSFSNKVDINVEIVDAEHAFGKTVALMLKNIRGHKKRRKAQLEIMQVLCKYDSGSDTE